MGKVFGKSMKENLEIKIIGYVRSPHTRKADIPKGLGAKHVAEGIVEVLPQFEDGLKDIDGFSHLFILWIFHQAQDYNLVGTPPCDDRSHGVFATRSPRRPNPLGLTVVELMRREINQLFVCGIDMLDGTPVVDIKPYMSGVSKDKLKRGWLQEVEERNKE